MTTFLDPRRVHELWEQGIRAQRKQIMDYNLNALFCSGEQWVWANTWSGGIDEIPRLDPERVRMTADVLWPRTSQLVAAATNRPLLFVCNPRAADDASVQGAQLCSEVISHEADIQNWEQHREDQMWTTLLGGTAALCLEWDVTSGTAIRTPDTNIPISTPDGRRALHTGDLSVSVLSIPEIVCQPGTRDAERGLYWIKLVALPPEEVQALFDLPEVPRADAGSIVSPAQYRMADQSSSTSNQQLTGVYTYYERPSKKSDGQVIMVVNNERVQEAPWPFPFRDRLNIAVSRETPRHARWMGDTILSTSRIVQMGVNQAWSSLIEHTKKAGNSRQWVNQATKQLQDLTDEPGEIAVYVGPEKPFRADPAQLPNWLIQQPDRLIALIDGQLSTEEVGRGVAPRNVESGLGLSILSEKAGTRLERLAGQTARSWSTLATMAAETLASKVKDTRDGYLPPMPDYGLPARNFEWTGESFQGQTKVEVPVDAIRPRSAAQVQALAQNLFDREVISIRQYARMIQVPESESITAIADEDTAKAERENWMMAQNRAQVPHEVDDDAKHIKVVESFMKTERFERLDDDTRGLFEMHRLAHQQSMKDKASQAMEEALAAGMPMGAPTGPQQPPTPELGPSPDFQFDANSQPPEALALPPGPTSPPSTQPTQQPEELPI